MMTDIVEITVATDDGAEGGGFWDQAFVERKAELTERIDVDAGAIGSVTLDIQQMRKMGVLVNDPPLEAGGL
jgi:hypothetical protein